MDECPKYQFRNVANSSKGKERQKPALCCRRSRKLEKQHHYCTLAFASTLVWFTGNGCASVLNTQSSRESTSSSQKRR